MSVSLRSSTPSPSATSPMLSSLRTLRARSNSKARPLSIFVNTYGTAANGLTDAEIAVKINELFDLRPAKIIEKFGLKKPIYEPTASYGHVGRDPYKATVMVRKDGQLVPELVQFFGWELLDSVDMIRKAFAL